MNDAREYLHRMEEYIPPVEAAAPGGRDNRDPTDPNQLRSGAASGEMRLYGSSIASSSLPDADNFEDPDSRRDTFSNEEAIASQLDVPTEHDFVSSQTHRKPKVLDMSDPTYLAPRADFLPATEYVVEGVTYDPEEVLEGCRETRS